MYEYYAYSQAWPTRWRYSWAWLIRCRYLSNLFAVAASGNSKQVGQIPDAACTDLSSRRWAENRLETCRELTIIKSIIQRCILLVMLKNALTMHGPMNVKFIWGRNAHNVGECERRRPLGRSRRRWKDDNNNMALQELGWEPEVDSSGLRQGVGCCERGNELSVSMKWE